MSDAEKEMPEWLRAIPPQTDDEAWAQIEWRFHDLLDTLNQAKLETKEQAIPRRIGDTRKNSEVTWEDPEVEFKVRPWLQIPFDPDRDEEQILLKREVALGLAYKLEPKIKARNLDASFLAEWGAFTEYAAIVEHEFLRNQPKFQYLKGAEAQSREQHKRWYAKVFVALKSPGDRRADTDGKIIDFIQEILRNGIFPSKHHQRDWFQELLSDDEVQMTASFRQNKLSEVKIRELASIDGSDLPPTDRASFRHTKSKVCFHAVWWKFVGFGEGDQSVTKSKP